MTKQEATELLNELNSYMNSLDKYLDYTNTFKGFLDHKFNNSAQDEALAIRQNEQSKEDDRRICKKFSDRDCICMGIYCGYI